MIKEIELENVRIFEGSGWKFPIAPLTAFCGTNSAGKSTLLKVLLLLRQSQGGREATRGREGRLQFVGSQVDLGDYRSYVSHNDIRRPLSIGITIEDKAPYALLKEFFSEDSVEKKQFALDDEESPGTGDVVYVLKAHFTFGANKGDDLQQDLYSDVEVSVSSSQQSVLQKAEFEVIVGGQILLEFKILPSIDQGPSKRDQGPSKRRVFDILIPFDYYRKSGALRTVDVERSVDSEYVRFRTRLESLLPEVIIAKIRPKRKAKAEAEEPERFAHFPLPPLIYGAIRDLQFALNSIHYLGPLRSPAKRYYVAYLDATPTLDAAGEFLPLMLKNRSDIRVLNVRPGPGTEPLKEPLPIALNAWLHYLRTGRPLSISEYSNELTVSTKADVLVEMKMKTVHGSESHALADSGFGYSQVLPILVRGLIAAKGHTLLVEQPELHLNPALQVRLAEFFAAMVKAGKQVLIETHTEHIVNALRVLSAEDETGNLASMCRVHFLSAEEGLPVTRELSVRPDGTVPDWPKDFFGEAISLGSRLLKAQKRFLRKETKNE